jgi:PAS domain S-box-containing protein
MNYHKLLHRQINKFLPKEIAENAAVKDFLNAVQSSYEALERDKELVERAYAISENEYIAINQEFAREAELKMKSITKLKESIGEFDELKSQLIEDDLLVIVDFLNQQILQRKSAQKVFTSLVGNSQSGILLEDENRKIVFTNQLFCDLFQIPVAPDHLIGADCSDSAQQSKILFKEPEQFVVDIEQILYTRDFDSKNVIMADDRILKREYIPIFIDEIYKGHLWSYTDITERKRSQEAIEQSELKNRLIMNSALDAIITIDENGFITFWNPKAEKIFGWTESEVLGKTLTDNIIPNYHKDGHDNGMKAYNKTGHGPALNKLLELKAVNKYGKEFPIELSIIPVKQGDTKFFCSFIRDISDRKKNEEDLRASRELWQFALEGAGDGVWEYNFQTNEVFFSKRYKDMLGYDDSDFKNESFEWKNRIHPNDLQIIAQTDQDYEKGIIKNHQREYRIKHKNGNYIWILDRGMVVSYNDDGKPQRIIGTHSDITERKTSEQTLKIREEKYRSILSNMNLGLIEVDNDDVIQYANQSFLDMSGYAFDELMGQSAADLLLDKEHQNFIFDKNKQRKTGVSDAYELPVKNKKKEQKWWLISGAPRYNDTGELVGSVGIHLDITEQKKLEEDLIRARDFAQASTIAKENFLANMSHEIRTPMSAILGMANQLNKTNLNNQQQFFLNTIHSSAESLLVIINDILDLSKIESGKLTIEKIGFEPKKVMEHVMQVMQHRAEEKGLSFTNSFYDTSLSDILLGDPHRISQVILNLVSNAIKFTQKGSIDLIFKVLASIDNEQILQVSVTDSGIGMDEDFLEKLFDKFSQEDSSITRNYGGTGLGMSICKELITLMGGEMTVNSIKNLGSSVSFVIKLEKGTFANLPIKENIEVDAKLLAGKHILVTDDNEINRLLASTVLTNYKAKITEAVNGLDAVEKVRQSKFDLVLMDIQMPVMDGLEASRTIRRDIDKNIPIIALTAFAIKGDNDKCLDAGMNDYLSKPFEESQLLEIAAKWLGKSLSIKKSKVQKTEQLFSLSQLEGIAKGNQDFIHKMIKLFCDQTPESIKQIKIAYQQKDFDKISKIAHRIKPSINSLAITSIIPVVNEIEEKATEYQSSNKLENLIKQLEKTIDKVVEELSQV